MAIRRFFTKQVTVRREKELGSDKVGFSATATVETHYQDLDREARQRAGIIEERAWRFWFPVDKDIQEGDILRDENNVEYYVREVTTKDYGINQHLEVLAGEHNA